MPENIEITGSIHNMHYTHLSNTTPVARKIYPCVWCNEKILLGEKHVKEVGTYDGFQSNRWHNECYNAAVKAFKENDDYEFEPHSCKRGTSEELKFMKPETLQKASSILGQDLIDKVKALPDNKYTEFMETVEELIEEVRRDRKDNEKIPSKEEIVQSFHQYGYIIPKGAEFYKINAMASKRGHTCYGMKVGEYTHSCHIDTTECVVLLIVDGTYHGVVDTSDMWITKLFTV
jgi:hypothetical protein